MSALESKAISDANVVVAYIRITGSVNGPMWPLLPKSSTRTPRRCNACPSSRPMMPGPKIATERGRSLQSNTPSLTTRRSPSDRRNGGIEGEDPVAITALPNVIVVVSSTLNVRSSTKRALPRMRSVGDIASTPSSTKPTNRSRSRLTLSMTARPSTRTAPSSRRPNWGQRCGACPASAAAIRSLLGMQPTRAQVVPCGPPSIRTTRLPCAIAARYAAKPEVPAPMTATSTDREFMKMLVD